jgi:Ankyrin repeats (3 copies)
MSNDAPEDPALDAAYRRAARAAGVPAEATRRAILAHARGLAASRAPGTLGSRARVSWARPALFGALAASVVAGLLLAPRWKLTGTAPAALAARVAPAAPAEAPVQIAPSEVLPQEHEEARAAAPAPAPLLAQQRKEDLPASPLGSPPGPRPDAGDTLAEPTVLGGLAAGRSAAISNTTTQHVAAAAPVPELPGAALRRAAAAGDLAQLEALSRGPPDLNARDAQGRTALLLATVNGHANAVAALLAYGADPRIADIQGVTPLAAARSAGNTEIVAILARYGVR